ncbi:ribosomal-processing cysteine protease Prp [Gallibacter intestinalis]|uniref:Ribosomal processing cysteine protease Prp n=1 Tax=Gallibacter intestinalis TaxID=2779356 RepID=A0ABR9QY64_9FIRM|nr:ribosomal-processing cysteine protease Prp [Gallibacter intestinalis]MBE5035820.1 ribosomal-processing cysteine protease Prp [Gallibacter intestinalis]
MITVKVSKDEVQIRGHAGYAPIGEDIVCSGVTALYQTTVGYIADVMNEPLTVKESKQTNEYTLLTKDLSDEAKVLVGAFLYGLKLIEEEFPNHITIEQA